MKLNKKGMTLVELIISVALLSVVLGFMFKLLLDVKYEHDNAGFAIKNQINRADIIKTIQNDFEELGLLSYSEVSTKKLNFTFNNTNKTLEIKNGSVLKYGGKKWAIKDEGYKFGDIKVNTINSEYITVVIPVSSGAEDNTDIDNIMLVTKYKTLEKPYLNDAILSHAKDNNYLKPSDPDYTHMTSNGEYGLYKKRDDLGVSYYFRGDVTNNYVKLGSYTESKTVWRGISHISHIDPTKTMDFASKAECLNYNQIMYGHHIGGDSSRCENEKFIYYENGDSMYWRVVRINGDGSIRLIYDGVHEYRNNGKNTSYIGSSQYRDTTTPSLEYTGSSVENVLNNWYNKHLSLNSDDYIVMGAFCNNTLLNTNFEYYNSSYIRNRHLYDSFLKIYSQTTSVHNITKLSGTKNITDYKLSLTCDGNIINSKVGLITAEEAALAGGIFSTPYSSGSKYYLFDKEEEVSYLTMTGADADKTGHPDFNNTLGIGAVASDGSLQGVLYGDKTLKVRPVININAEVKVLAGDGTIDSPYEIILEP